MATNNNPPFYLGLCMAGAISAGAYTAGVVDYLMEALDRWEQARNSNDPRVPNHRVIIDIMTGASAGGMTAAIATAALHDHTDPVNERNGGYQHFTGENKLYVAWVKLIQDEMLPVLLSDGDLAEHGAASVLNSNFVDYIANQILQVDVVQHRPYVSEDLELCLSLSNLTGIEEVIVFDNDSETNRHRPREAHEVSGRYISVNHRDFGHFVLGSNDKPDGRIPFHFGKVAGEGLTILRDCAMATGAFPVGLRWRAIRRKGKYLLHNKFITHGNPGALLGLKAEQMYESVNVDGGLLNNEPFEIAEQLLKDRKRKYPVTPAPPYLQLSVPLSSEAVREMNEKTQASVLMIEPFPTVENGPQIKPQKRLLLRTLIGQIYSTMRTQLRFKQEDIRQATEENVISKYIIAPTRKVGKLKIAGSKAIACGSLGGFGGFLTQSYREHDFQLGRINCQHFLQKYFRIEADTDNVIFKEGYTDEARAMFSFTDKKKTYLPIIPDIDLANLNTSKPICQSYDIGPTFPCKTEKEIRELVERSRPALKNRLYKVLDANGAFSNLWIGLAARLFKSALMNTVARQIEELVINDLYDHKLLFSSQLDVDPDAPAS